MENNPDEYDAGTDQNQGVVGTMARNQQPTDPESASTQVPELDPNRVTSQTDNEDEGNSTDGSIDTMDERQYLRDEGTD